MITVVLVKAVAQLMSPATCASVQDRDTLCPDSCTLLLGVFVIYSYQILCACHPVLGVMSCTDLMISGKIVVQNPHDFEQLF